MTRFLLIIVVACTLVPATANGQGTLSNGGNHEGTISAAGEIDTWLFGATAGDSVTISIGEASDPTGRFVPHILLVRPDGSSRVSANNYRAAQFSLRAPLTGTYAVRVSSGDVRREGTGAYVLRLARVPEPFAVPPNDEGGPMKNGANHYGSIALGDLDMWSFPAKAGDSLTVSLGELADNSDGSFVPSITLIQPDGTWGPRANNYRAAQVSMRATLTGTYTVLVTTADVPREGVGDYRLTLARVPAPYQTSKGDDGGVMKNGANHRGSIHLGDVDIWSFPAKAGDSLTVSLGELADNSDGSFVPSITLIGPDGTWGPRANNYRAAQVSMRATLTGTYTVLVTTADVPREGVGDYELTLARVPAPYEPSKGDEGGVMKNGANHRGSIHLGDVDIWSFPANAGDSLTVSLGERVDRSGGSFVPSIRLVRPDGSLGPGASNYRAVQISHRATITGTYTVLVTTADVPRQGVGDYVITLARTPSPFIVPSGDEGGPLTRSSNNRGRIHLSDVDLWTLRANANEVITIGIKEIADQSQGRFVPSIFLIKPDGSSGPYSTGYTSAQVSYKAPVTGTYTVLVTTTDVPREGVGTYTVTSSHAGVR